MCSRYRSMPSVERLVVLCLNISRSWSLVSLATNTAFPFDTGASGLAGTMANFSALILESETSSLMSSYFNSIRGCRNTFASL